MAKTHRNSVENMFAKKGSVQPQKKEIVKEDPEGSKASEEIQAEPITVEEEPKEKPEEIKEESKEIPKEEPKEETGEKNEPKTNKPSNIDNLFAKKKKERGHQQTIYFKKEVYDFCDDIAERYELGMSDVVNKLILSIMEESE